MRLYRIVVTKWPTDDGQPWPRFVSGYGDGAHGAWVPDWDELPWFKALVDPDTSPVQDKIDAEFVADHDQAGEITGWILPDTKRRHYLSRAAAYRWVERGRLLGAECHVAESEPVVWPGDR